MSSHLPGLRGLQTLRTRLRRWRWAVVVRPRRRTITRILGRKTAQRVGKLYVEAPRVSIILQSFNQSRNIHLLERRLRLTCAEELIVCEDGSVDGSLDAWARRLTGPNDFLLRSNDIHEIRSYGRAIGYARGDIVCLMQDDDRPPRDGSWLAEAIALFDRYPRLAVLGGWCGFDEFFDVEYNAPWLPAGTGHLHTEDPATGRPLRFVESVNIGPYLVRRQVYFDLGGFDSRFSPPGEPGITFESEFCYRAWCQGHEVAVTDIPVKLETGKQGYILPGGTTLWDNDARVRNERANKARLVELYADRLPEIQAAVKEANTRLRIVERVRAS